MCYMKNERTFYKCSICGNLVGVIEDGGGKMVCCNKDMEKLIANTTDGAKEKHVPVATFENGILKVDVGSVPHPMTEEHHISWIMVAQGKTTQRACLDITDKPSAEFCTKEGPVTVYEYCNLHGLWVNEIL